MTQWLPPAFSRSLPGILGSLLLAVLTTACGGGSDARFDNDGVRVLTEIEVSPATASVFPDETTNFSATGLYSDGSRDPLSSSVAWSSSDAAVATVDASGTATGIAAGESRIRAELDGISGEAVLTVNTSNVASVEIFPPRASLPLGTTQDFRAFALMEDGSLENVTFDGQWSMSNQPAILERYDPRVTLLTGSLDDFGTAVGVAVGADDLEFAYQGRRAVAAVEVTEAQLEAITIAPRDQGVPVGSTTAFTAYGVFTDGTGEDITDSVTWSSSETAVAGISNESPSRGLAEALSLGETTITASQAGLSDSTRLRVTSDPVLRVDVSPADSTIFVGSQQQFTATAVFASGETEDVTRESGWSSDDTQVASIDDTGRAVGQSPGEVEITALFSGTSGTALLTVEQGVELETITVDPAAVSLFPLQRQQLTATAGYSDGSTRDVTDEVTWTSENQATAAVSNADEFGRGNVLGLSPGTTSVSASFPDDPVSGSAEITVLPLPEVVKKLEVNPPSAAVLVGESQRYEATLVLENGGKLDVTSHVSWTSSNPAIASVDGTGLAHGDSPGATTIRARLFNTEIEGNASLVVRAPVTLERVVVSPPSAEVVEGASRAYTAAALLSNGEQVDVTSDVDWTTGDSAVAQISSGGIATGIAAGSTSVTATLETGGRLFSGSAGLTVVPEVVIEAIIVSPPEATIFAGSQQQYRAEARLSDGRSVDVSSSVDWGSSDTGIAQVAPGGLATGTGVGTAVISARLEYEGDSFTGTAELVVDAVTVQSIQVNPQQSSVVTGGSVVFTATATLSDQSTRDITQEASWFTTDEAVALIESGASAGRATGIAAGSSGVYVEYSDNGVPVPCEGLAACQATLEVVAPAIAELQVTPAVATIPVGEVQAYAATALLENGDHLDVSGQVSWRSADDAIASVDPSGLAQGVSAGQVAISAVLADADGSFSDTADLTVTAPPVSIEDLRVTPENITILSGNTQQYTATALLSDGSQADVTDKASWRSNDTAVAHIDSSGLATGLIDGQVEIEASVNFEGVVTTGSTGLTVEAPLTITEIRVTPSSGELLTDETLQFTATAVLSDLTTRDVTDQSLWFSSDAAVASVASGAEAGLATAKAPGRVSVWAEFSQDGVTYPCEGIAGCQATLDVLDPVTAVRLDVSPQAANILQDSTIQFTADLVLSDGNVVDVTGQVGWDSSDDAIATPQTPAGLFIGLAEGSVTVTASGDYQGAAISGTATLTVEPPPITVDRLEVVPPTATVFVGDSGNFQALAYLSNGEVQDVTQDSVWRSGDPSIVVIDPATGFAQAVTAGQTRVSATLAYRNNTAVGESLVTVTEAQAELLEVSPTATTLPAGNERQYRAILHYEDGREEPVTDSVRWESSNPQVAVVSGANGSEGMVTALAVGEARIRAIHDSGLQGEGILGVIAPTLVSLVIDPASTDLVEGEQQRLFALATFSDESVLDVSDTADWSSDNAVVASVGNELLTAGLVTGNTPGTATVTATYQGLNADSSVTVQANSLVDGWIEPPNNTLQVGDEEDYRAFGVFLDGSNREITDEVTWQTTDPDVAVVGNVARFVTSQVIGRVLAVAEGNAEIFASFEGAEVDRSPLTVVGLTTDALEVAPASADLLPGETLALSATATYSDSSTGDVTALSIWESSDTAVVVVRNKPDSPGSVIAVGPGTATITARYDGLSDSAVINATAVPCEGRPASIVIDAGDQTVPEGQTVLFTARGIYDDGCEQDITESNQTVWRSLDKKICNFDSPKGGEATGLKEGVASVEATHRGRTDTATCTVTPRED